MEVPAKIESNFVTGSGEKASSIEEAFQFKSDKVCWPSSIAYNNNYTCIMIM